MIGHDDIDRWIAAFLADIRRSVGPVITEPRRAAAAVAVAAVAYVILVLSSFPAYTYELLAADLGYLGAAVLALTGNLYASTGAAGIAAIVIYAVLTGIAVVHLAVQVRVNGGVSMLWAGGTAPAFLIGGCAGCGAGFLGLLGFAGALTLLPFHGNGLRWAGVVLFVYFLARAGDPTTCDV